MNMATPQTDFEEPVCICGSRECNEQRVLARDEITSEIFQYVQCAVCGAERLSPRPVRHRIGQYYPTNYYAHTPTVSPTGARSSTIERLLYFVFFAPRHERPHWVSRLRWLLYPALFPIRFRTRLCFNPPQTRRIFEFGAARGDDLYTFRELGWDVSGCEPSSGACEVAKARGITLQCTAAEDAVLPQNFYSCILLNNVFEHLYDPSLVLAKCHEALIDDGVLLLIIPNHDSLSANLFGAAWPGYDAPRHLWGFTPASLVQALERAGFEVETVKHQAPTAWCWQAVLSAHRSVAPVSRLRQQISGKAAYLLLPLGVIFSLLQRGDFMRVVARKSG